jgi:hypothetical protein
VIDKEMAPEAALRWLRAQDLNTITSSPIVRADIERVMANSAIQ